MAKPSRGFESHRLRHTVNKINNLETTKGKDYTAFPNYHCGPTIKEKRPASLSTDRAPCVVWWCGGGQASRLGVVRRDGVEVERRPSEFAPVDPAGPL